MAKRSAQVFTEVAQEHLRRLNRVAERGSAARLHKLYQQSLDEMERRSRTLLRGRDKDTFTAHHRRIVLAQLRDRVRELVPRLSGALVDHAHEAQVEGRSSTLQNIAKLEERYSGTTPVLPVEEAARFVGIGAPTRSLLRNAKGHGVLPDRIQTSMARYGARLITQFEQELAKSILQGETVLETTERIRIRGDLEWWQAERIARTETAWAYNGATYDAVRDASTELDDMMMRWNEHVDDATGQPFDDRVAPDSMAMHGQVARPGEAFVMPTDERVASERWGLHYEFPPNRPNDRAAVMPWRPHWGIPGWKWNGSMRVPVT
jgi:hypothetical protein